MPTLSRTYKMRECQWQVSNSNRLFVVMAYAAVEALKAQAKDSFYIRLYAVLDRNPTKNTTILLEDMNAKGRSRLCRENVVVGSHDIQVRNYKCSSFVNLCWRNTLVIITRALGGVQMHMQSTKLTTSAYHKGTVLVSTMLCLSGERTMTSLTIILLVVG